jgi:hypothetical protein
MQTLSGASRTSEWTCDGVVTVPASWPHHVLGDGRWQRQTARGAAEPVDPRSAGPKPGPLGATASSQTAIQFGFAITRGARASGQAGIDRSTLYDARRMATPHHLAALVLLTTLAASARAAPTNDESPALPFDPTRLIIPLPLPFILTVPGDLTLRYQHLTPIALGPVAPADPRRPDPARATPEEDALFARLRLSPALFLLTPDFPFTLWRLQAEVDAFNNWVATGARGFLDVDPRARADAGFVGQRLSQLSLAAVGEHVAVQVGLTRSSWGMGLLANAGTDPRPHKAESPFGFPLQGDRVIRVGASAFPLGQGLRLAPPLTVSLAFDTVYDDDLADYERGDRAYQVATAVLGHTTSLTAGFYVAHRFQDHWQGGSTSVTAFDLYARVALAETDGVKAFLELELATLRGNTSLAQTTHHEGAIDIDQLGALVRFGVERGPFLGVLELGALSGDNNPFDDEQRGFAADRDHRVGLLLFREVMTAHAAVTANNVADPDYRGTPPRGYENLATRGAARGVFYANPRVSFALADKWHLYGGFVYATTDGENVDPFWSGIAGGAPRGPRDGPPATELGYEVDLGLSARLDVYDFDLDLRLEGAYFSPGKVFADESGALPADVWAAFFHGGLLW